MLFQRGKNLEAIDLYEALAVGHPHAAIDILAELYDLYQMLPQNTNRYALYQSRLFDFAIKPGDRILDIGSGNDPFPFATHLADVAPDDDRYGRAGAPFKRPEGIPVTICTLEDMSCFPDKQFDFVYCSHVLEHVADPERACRELMRIGKRGYVETPTRGKDLWLNTAEISHHRWAVELLHGRLTFTEYLPREIQGLRCDLLMKMHVAPESKREKALTSLLYLKADLVNTMLLWEGSFDVEVRKIPSPASSSHMASGLDQQSRRLLEQPAPSPSTVTAVRETPTAQNVFSNPRCLFINTYYDAFLSHHYSSAPSLIDGSYEEQLASLQETCFGDSDFYSSALRQADWEASDIIVNCRPLQKRWAEERGIDPQCPPLTIAIEQIKRLRPQVLYLQDLGVGSREFLAAARPYVDLIVGQIASPIPPNADLDAFDVLISSFPHFVDRFRGEKRAAYYQALAFDIRVFHRLGQPSRDYPLTFVGGLSPAHRERHELLADLGKNLPLHVWGYGTTALKQHHVDVSRLHGEAWGLDMFSILARSRITVNHHIDVAKMNANNMRLFEATGCGSLLVTDYKENLSDLFEIGTEVVAYRSVGECRELIAYYLAHPEEARAIAERAHERTGREHTYEARMRHTSEILGRHLELKTGNNRLPDPDLGRVSYGRTAIRPDQVTPDLVQSWRSDSIPLKQRALVDVELREMYRGQPPIVFRVLADAVQPYVRPNIELLEIGCASGYYAEALQYLLNVRLSYFGIDFSEAMIRMARSYYPNARFEVGDGGSLSFADRSIPIVVSSGVLLHVQEYRAHIKEAARVASAIVVLHRTPVTRKSATAHFKKFAYGVETFELRFSESEILSLCEESGLELSSALTYHEQPDKDEFETTYVFNAAR
ncbi:hypothetical protein W02_19200 [Nitrospira sp. KM1]|uniref:glycosyltransferase family protein n=1 Tax=Nitrospira sp. KM1 TaxID=1936990 RepID=UPI0013A75842|nr:glycosyltransferase [Nitrospira sp. KM1]BCA54780.1 hypothetical protein W02_19200 [Nitrospira sp. KM1]